MDTLYISCKFLEKYHGILQKITWSLKLGNPIAILQDKAWTHYTFVNNFEKKNIKVIEIYMS